MGLLLRWIVVDVLRRQIAHQSADRPDLGGRPFERDRAAIHHIGVLRPRAARARRAARPGSRAISRDELGQPLGDLLDHADPHAFGWLVQHQQLWPPEQRAADREHLAFAARQRAGGLPEPLASLGKISSTRRCRTVRLADRAQQQVLAYRQLGQRWRAPAARNRCRAARAARPARLRPAAVEADRAAIGRHLAGKRLEQRRLAGAVAAEDRDRTPRWRRQADAEQHLAAAVAGIRPTTLRMGPVRHGSYTPPGPWPNAGSARRRPRPAPCPGRAPSNNRRCSR